MKKIVKLSESELSNIVQRVINEQEENRIKMGIAFGRQGIKKAKREGYAPHYFDFKNEGDYKLVEVDEYSDKLDNVRIFLLKPDEIGKIQKHIDIVNEMIKKKLEQFKLLKDFILSVTAQKIMD